MNIVYLIGNGFDLNLGMKTRYIDFYKYYLRLPKRNDDNAVTCFKKTLEKEYRNWSDLENALGAKYLSEINVDDAVSIYRHITTHLPKYLDMEASKYTIHESHERFLKYLCEPYSENWLLPHETEEIKKHVSTCKPETFDIKIITFNYTKTIEKLLGIDTTQPIQEEAYHTTHNIEIEHIHGFTNDRLILGVNDASQINNESLRKENRVVKRYVKEDCIRLYRTGHDAKCQEWINNADLICLFGLSFGSSDKKWWNLVSNELQNGRKAIIFQYTNEVFSKNGNRPDLEDFKERAKEEFLSKTDIEKDLRDTLKKNIYVAPKTQSADMFEFAIKPKTIRQHTIVTFSTIALCLIMLVLFALHQPRIDFSKNSVEKELDVVDTIAEEDKPEQTHPVESVTTPPDTNHKQSHRQTTAPRSQNNVSLGLTGNKEDEELATYKKYATLNPNDLAVRRRIGEIHYRRKQWSDVITNLEMFLTNNDNDVNALIMLVDAYVATNQQQKAKELLIRAKNLKNNNPDIRERIYIMYKKEGQKELAEAEIRDLAEITKDNKHRLMLCGDLMEAGKLDEAASMANAIKRSDPTNRDGLMALAGIQKLQKKYSDAIETYKLVLFADNNYAPACAGRADVHFLLAEYDRAETYYKKALEIDPQMASAEFGLSRVYKATKQKDLQVQHLNKAKLLDPNNKAVLDELRMLK